jgi:hypothetical protein
MTQLRRRLANLEHQLRKSGGCRICGGEPRRLTVFGREQLRSQNLEPCPACGLAPEVTVIQEIVVSTREEVRQLLGEKILRPDGSSDD